ncbi:MAG: hypothetical protein QXM96_03630 [Candidatus Woesearchaeota archaeon]
MKKKLTQMEEFEILKLVLDKFLWMGFAIMGYGFYLLVSGNSTLITAMSFTFAGVVLLMLFVYILLREYEITKRT